MKRMTRWLIAALLLMPATAGAQAGPVKSAVLVVPEAERTQEQAIEYSDAYYTRLTIHRAGSYAMLPLFAAQYIMGDRLLNGLDNPDWLQPAHTATAVAIGALFTSNTITGVWNLAESRKEKQNRTRRFVHAGLMLAADAGFVYTGVLGSRADSNSDATKHRNTALTSIGLSTAGAALMWFWPDD